MFNNELTEICKLLKAAKKIAVVGISKDPTKTSREIANYLVTYGYEVVGVNPFIKEEQLDGIKIYHRLTDIPGRVDIVDVFRRSEDIPEIIDDVLNIAPKALWLQQGIRNDSAVKPVIEIGIKVIQDKCIAVYYNLCRPYLSS
jgi:hypothetical protein